MRADAFDFSFEQDDPGIEFVKRIPFQAFTGEAAGGSEVAFGRPPQRSVVFVHCNAASDWNGILSMGRWLGCGCWGNKVRAIVDTWSSSRRGLGRDGPGAALLTAPKQAGVQHDGRWSRPSPR